MLNGGLGLGSRRPLVFSRLVRLIYDVASLIGSNQQQLGNANAGFRTTDGLGFVMMG